jgi:hypothetical protein
MHNAKILILCRSADYSSLFNAILPAGSHWPSPGRTVQAHLFNYADTMIQPMICSDYQSLWQNLPRSHYFDTDAIIIWTDLAESTSHFIQQKAEQLKEDLKPRNIDAGQPFSEAKIFIMPYLKEGKNPIMHANQIRQSWQQKVQERGYEHVRILSFQVLETVNPDNPEAIRDRLQSVISQLKLDANGEQSAQDAAQNGLSLYNLQRRASNAWNAMTGIFKPPS